MSSKKTTPERLTAFSDGVFSVIITIMVLDLKPPAEATLRWYLRYKLSSRDLVEMMAERIIGRGELRRVSVGIDK